MCLATIGLICIMTLCTGVLLSVSNTETPEGCQIVCQNDPKCKWYTHDSSNQGCFTFEDCAAINEDCGTCVSGEFNCRIEGKFYVGIIFLIFSHL